MRKIIYQIGIALVISSLVVLSAFNYLPLEPIQPLSVDENYNGMLGTSITTIAGSDTLKASRTVINDNFTSLNTGKIETSTTTLPLLITLENLSTIGTIGTGTWTADAIGVGYGGTGTTSPTSKQIMIGNGANGLQVIGFGAVGQFLVSAGDGAVPAWTNSSVDETADYTWTGEHNWSATSTMTGDLLNNTNIISLEAGTTITGNATPQPVYIATSTGTLQLCDSDDDGTYYDFFGFAITSATSGNNAYVQYDGIVSGFTGLTAGLDYYVQDTAGTIASSHTGTTTIMIGRAVSTTQLMINREKRAGTAVDYGMSSNIDYYAHTDRMVGCYVDASDNSYVYGYINDTIMFYNSNTAAAGSRRSGGSMFIPKYSTWKCVLSGTGTKELKYITYN